MQSHLHQLQQQLTSLLSVALPPPIDDAAASSQSSPESAALGKAIDESSRIAALDSLRRAVLYPPNAPLLPHCAHFLSQGIYQLLSDMSYGVRKISSITYASLCAVLASSALPTHAHVHSHAHAHVQVICGGLIDRFFAWALPLLRDFPVRNGSAELALNSLREFLGSGDATSVERYVPSILKACQELLEDERTSLSLLHQILNILTLISLKFGHCFQPHFIDIVDLLLGWAFMPDLSDSGRRIITDSFLQFRKHWISNVQFSLGLLSKLLGDAQVLIYDESAGIAPQLGRLLSLFSCFSTILQATTSGILEMNLLGQITDPLENLTHQLLKFILMFVRKYGWSKGMGEPWRCLILLAEILKEKIAQLYPIIIDILFCCLEGVPSIQVHGLLKTNLQFLYLQNMVLLPSSVRTLLQFHSPFSQLRLHSNHSVVATSAASYLFLLQHGCDEIVSQAITCLLEELDLLRRMLAELQRSAVDCGLIKVDIDDIHKAKLDHRRQYSELDLLSLIKFDLKVISCSMCVDASRSFVDQTITDATRYERSSRVTSFIINKFLPFQFPIEGLYELQAHVIKTLHEISEIEILAKFAVNANDSKKASSTLSTQDHSSFEAGNEKHIIIAEYLSKFNGVVVRSLNASSPLTVKIEALSWVRSFSQMILNTEEDNQLINSLYEPYQNVTIGTDLVHSILDAAFDREPKVRSDVAPVLEFLLQAGLIHPGNFYLVSEVVLNKLSDPDMNIKNAFVRLISIVVPVSLYIRGIADGGYFHKLRPTTKANLNYTRPMFYLNWKQALSMKQMPQKLHSQQLVSVLNYISQRWKVPHSSWIRRLVFSCRGGKDGILNQDEVIGDLVTSYFSKDAKAEESILQKTCPVNSLAAIWWSINEAARHCINLRLRTNLGGPAQTFTALERMLLDIPDILKLDIEQSEGQYLGSSNFHLLPMRLLLDFVEALKKNVYNAYEGSAVLPHANPQSALFFRANKKVCEEWFSRICDPMLNAGLALNYHYATYYYCTQRLQQLKKLPASNFMDKTQGIPENFHNVNDRFTGDMLKVLQHASLALCKVHEPEALIGLQKWVGMMFPSFFADDNQFIPSVNGDMYFSWMTGLVYQAQGQYEKAAAHFSHLLQSEEALGYMGSDGIQFIISRVIESYTSVSDWKSLENWLSELQALRSMHAGKSYSGALTAAGNELNAIHALARFDEGDIQAAWGSLDLTPKSSCQLTLDPNLAFERSEQMLLRSMLQNEGDTNKGHMDLDKAKLMLDEALSCIPLDGLNEATALAVQLHCIFALKESKMSKGQQLPSIMSSLSQSLHFPISRIHQDSSLWMKIFRIYCTIMPASYVTTLLGQKILSLARKQSNFMLADRLKKYLQEHPSSEQKHSNFLAVNLQYEEILLKYAAGKPEEALLDLWSFVYSDFQSRTTTCFTNTCCTNISSIKAKACLKLSTWMSLESSNINLSSVISKIHEDLTFLSRVNGTSICSSEVLFSSNSNQTSDTKWDAVLEEIIGTFTKLSCKLCPKLGKSWLSYAAWCFAQANNSLAGHGPFLQSCSMSSILDEEISSLRCHLTEEEKSKVKSVITSIYHSRNHVAVKRDQERYFDSKYPEYLAFLDYLVHETAYLMEAAAGAPGFDSFDGEYPSIVLFSELQALFSRTIAGMEKSATTPYIQELIDIWWSLRKRRVSLFGHAANGYFQFLSHSSSGLKGSNIDPDYTIEKYRSCTLRAMLYILRILFYYGVELEEIFNDGFATVPPLSWQEITPQLFARLSSHSQQAVRKQIEGLLMILAKLSPCSIVYPLLVNLNAYDGQTSEELQNLQIYMSNLYPKLIQDVGLFINELGGITILWEEQWLSTLQDLRTDVVRRINVLKEEASRITKNSTLCHAEKDKINAAKYSAMMAPIIVALERRLASTSREAETPHEQWFQKEYGKQLKLAILSFKTPPTSASALGDVWQAFDAIAAALATYQRKSIFFLREIAPKLAFLSSSNVPVPGLERKTSLLVDCGNTDAVQGIVTLSSFSEQVEILSTKTRPKKLALLGSDGQKYTYLLKGREDLRLDARIMQLLQAINGLFTSSVDSMGQSLGVRHYSVTPISGQAGLIQWVDNLTSIYSVYKSWQHRSQLAQFSATNPVPPVPRPSDMFYGKIIPALKEKGIRKVISRRDWPHEVKRKVLLDLMQETPRHLLWQEMWCSSEGFKPFHLKTRRFSGGVAAMSIVGHVLGLGDRHLDNILIDFSNGEVLHIDYSVCFDKGSRLKIPEIVPFRLTQTIESALGLTGTEGVFRANCETVINMLRKNKDIVLMLLEVFVWDPLVEWTREDNHDKAMVGGEEKKGMELAVSLSLFASRFQEIRVPLQEHHDLLVSTLPAAESSLKRFLDALIQFEILSVVFHHADKERSSVLQHEATAKSFAAEMTAISEKSREYFKAQAIELSQAKSLATEKAQEAAAWIEEHGRVLDELRSGSFPKAQACVKLHSTEEDLSLVSSILVSGVPLTVVPEPTQAQCYDLDREISAIIAELDIGLSCGIDALHEYSLVLQVLPFNYVTTSPVNSWAQVLQQSVDNLSSEVLSLARQAADIITKDQGISIDLIHKRHQDLFDTLERYAMEIEMLDKECSEQMESIGSDMKEKSKKRLLSAFSKQMQPAWHGSREAGFPLNHLVKHNHDGSSDLRVLQHLDDKKEKALCILQIALHELYRDVKEEIFSISKVSSGKISWKADETLRNDSHIFSAELEKQIEKCALLAGFVKEIQEFVGTDLSSFSTDDDVNHASEHCWATAFQVILHSIKQLIEKITGYVIPETIQSLASSSTEVMEAFGSLSHVRGPIDAALEKITEVELERASLLDLEKNYFMKVGLITEQQVSLEEAAVRGRDHLSWEETEELVAQGDVCRAQLDQLHHSWNKKDAHITSLARLEDNITDSLTSVERYFSSLISTEEDGESHTKGSTSLLLSLVKPFTELESVDQMLSSYTDTHSIGSSDTLSNLMSGYQNFNSIWRFSHVLKNHSFFIWKIVVVDSMLDSCIHEVSSSVDHHIKFDDLYNILKKKLEVLLQEHFCQYLKERVAPAFFTHLDRENVELLRKIEEMDFIFENTDYSEAVKMVKFMLEEYCNAHESARAARSTVYNMKIHVNQLNEALHKTALEIIQLEWLHEKTLPQLLKSTVFLQNTSIDRNLLNTSRGNLLEKMQSSVSSITRSLESLQALERTSIAAEAQLERAMVWACAGSSFVSSGSSSTKCSRIPSEFHDHLLRRRKLLWTAHEHASNVIKVCRFVIEFEASRDDLYWMYGENLSVQSAEDSQKWQQYVTALRRLDIAHHSFACAEQEWEVSQNKMEASSKGMLSATNDLYVASSKAKSASADLQDNLITLRKCVFEASLALSSFVSISEGYTALTSEVGSMLEEVLVITEGLDDLHSLAKEASSVHTTVVTYLAKVNLILLPLEASLSSDVATMNDANPNGKESCIDVPSIHGHVLYETYYIRLKEACQTLEILAPSITCSAKELYSMLIKLVRDANIHSGNLHKALEGLGESQAARSQELAFSRPNFSDGLSPNDKKLYKTDESLLLRNSTLLHEFPSDYEGWISPPDCSYTSSNDSTIISNDLNYNHEQKSQVTNSSDGNNSTRERASDEKSESGSTVEAHISGSVPSAHYNCRIKSKLDTDCHAFDVNEGASDGIKPSGSSNEHDLLSPFKGLEENIEGPPYSNPSEWGRRGKKNAYAMSVLRQVESKIEGRDIDDGRVLQASEVVDHLIKEATSIDNLCNMYEGWTPWI